MNFKVLGTDSNTISDGRWHHLAATWTGDTSPEGAKLFLDGKLIGTAKAVSPCSQGTKQLGIAGHASIPFVKLTGSLDEVMVFNKVLSPADILELTKNPPTGQGQ